MTSSAFHNLYTLVKCDQQQETTLQEEPSKKEEPSKIVQLQLDMETPFVPYKYSVLEEIPPGFLPVKDKFSGVFSSSVDKGIIEPTQNQSQDNSSTEESTIPEDTIDTVGV